MHAPAIIQRLIEEVMGKPFREISAAADLAAARAAPPKTVPALYVMPVTELPGNNTRSTGGLLQRVEFTFAVVHVIRNLRDAKGDHSLEDLQAGRDAVDDALLLWRPTGADMPIERRQGRILGFQEQRLWWQDLYITDYFLSRTS